MIPAVWPDAVDVVLTYLRSLLPGVTVTRTRRGGQCVVVDAEWQQLETPVSRRCTVLLEAFVKKSNGDGDAKAAVALMSQVLFHLQKAPDVVSGVVRFDQPVGPRIAVDPGEPKFEFAEGSIVLVFSS